ncbi:MAG: sigma-54 dependent transcriptional regulator [Pelovirga sp.]
MTTTDPHKIIILVDDDTEMRAAAAQWLELAGYEIRAFADAVSALAAMNEGVQGLVVTDVRMPKMDGMEFLARIRSLDADVPVVLITAHGDISMAVEAIRQGAYDFIEKPFDPDKLLNVVERAAEKFRLIGENRQLRQLLQGPVSIEQRLIGTSSLIKNLQEEILNLADTGAAVLIQGETGTGKEVAARCLHEFSQRHNQRFVAVNCAAVPEAVFESELFGYEKGAFTGAEQQRIGRFEYADKGTLFLDEIGSMPLALQAKVLRVLQEREVVRVGSNEPRAIDIRLICASNQNLREECRIGSFREDLFYRINVVELTVPPLREREEDVLLLFDYFIGQAAQAYQRPVVTPAPSGAMRLLEYDWPGNVRELKNVAERFVLSSLPSEQRLQAILASPGRGFEDDGRIPLQELMRAHEKVLLEHALMKHCGDIQAVMDELVVPRRTLNEKMARHQLDRRDYTHG